MADILLETKHYYYAQLNDKGICCSISDLASEMTESCLIAIDSFDESYMGKLWDGETWQELYSDEPIATYAPTKTDIMELALTQMEAIAEMYEQSEINRLNDMEVQAMIYETLLELQGA